MAIKLTPTERRMYDLLRADGMPHAYGELKACVPDELSERGAIHVHVTRLRKKINAIGLDILVRGVNGTSTWRLVRHVGPDE